LRPAAASPRSGAESLEESIAKFFFF
jgi:hypothetical protein